MNHDRKQTGKSLPERIPPGNVRGSEGFLRLQSEIDLAQAVSAARGVDWFLVRTLSSEILEKEGLDLLVACYLGVALAKTSGIAGLGEGISVLSGLVRDSWSTMFPPEEKVRSRRNAVSWWIEKTAETIASREWEPVPATLNERIRTELGALGEDLAKKDPEAPSLAPLFSVLEKKVRPALTETGGREEPDVPPLPADSSDPSDPEELFSLGSRMLKKAADLVFETDLRDPRCFRYSRMALWDSVSDLPDADGAVTRIPPPPPQFREALDIIAEKGAPEDLVRFSESHLETYPLWFDLSFYSARGLESMGKDAEAAMTALASETRTFLERCPGIERMLFSDGTPLASPVCREWLQKETEGKGEKEEAFSGLTEVRAILTEQNLPASIIRFDAVRKKTREPRERFLLDLEFLKHAAFDRSGEFPAEPMALAILEDIRNYRIEVWEPSLALRALRILFGILGEDPGISREILKRISAIDLGEAVEALKPTFRSSRR